MRRGLWGAKQALVFLQHPERFLTTTLVGTNIAIVTASTLLATSLDPYLSGWAITVISSTLLLFFGEILPKTIAREYATTFTLYSSLLLRFLYIVLYPIIRTIMIVSNFLLRLAGSKGNSVKRFFSRQDLELLVRESEKAGMVNEEERRLISRLILRGNQKVREIMIPRTEMATVRKNESISNAVALFTKTGYSRFPVVGRDVDDVVGMITSKDILLDRPRTITSVLRPIPFVPETRAVAGLLKDFQKQHTSLAIVVDEYGGTAGLVTLEDIVEEFFGDIQDEFDEDPSLYRKIGARQIDVHARVSISELNERFGLGLPEGEYQSLGGLLMDLLGHIPKRNEQAELDTCTLVVLSAFHRKVHWVRIIRKPAPPRPNTDRK